MAGEFVDTNVIVYTHDLSAKTKRQRAVALLERLLDERKGLLSTQVLMEFYVTVTKKIPRRLPPEVAAAIVQDFGTWTVHRPRVQDIVAASGIAKRYRISFWDAMIISSAQVLGASIIWSEDLNQGQDYQGVQVRNPFAS